MTLHITVYGLFDIPCGLQVAARNSADMLERCGHDVRRAAVALNGSLAHFTDERSCSDINLFHVNPEYVYMILSRNASGPLAIRESLNVCVPFWELPVLPGKWRPVLSAMDLVLAPTQFIRDAVHRTDPGLQVAHYPQAVRLPTGIVADRSAFEIPAGTTAFVFSLTVQSVVSRKNPTAAIQAFQRAFPKEREDVLLLLRIHSTGDNAPCRAVVESLRQDATGDGRIRFVKGTMSYTEVLSLYASADVYISLHRSEGLGLGPMEAMALGKPVIATGWSGNMDFMTGENSAPIGYHLVPVDILRSSAYGERRLRSAACWAEPDLDEAARAMRSLADDPQLRARLGAKAREDMGTRLIAFEQGQIVSVLERALAGMLSDRELHARIARWRRLQARALYLRWFRRPAAKAVRTFMPRKLS